MLPQGPVQQASLGLFAPAEMIGFASLSMRGETSTASRPIVHPELVVSQLAESLEVQQDLGLPRNDVMDYLSRPWSLESALANSIDLPLGGLLRSASKRSLVLSPLKDSNFSLNSRDGQYENGVDVEGLREALGKCRASCIFSYQCADFIGKNANRSKADQIKVPTKFRCSIIGRLDVDEDASRRRQSKG
jgi:hypothetical protein